MNNILRSWPFATICERIWEKRALCAMYKVSLRTKTCNWVMFSVKLAFCIFHTCGIVSCNIQAKLETCCPFPWFKPGGINTGHFLIITIKCISYLERAYLRNGSSYRSATKCNRECINSASTQHHQLKSIISVKCHLSSNLLTYQIMATLWQWVNCMHCT